MKEKQISVSVTETKNTGNYQSVKIGFDLVIELSEGDNLVDVKNKAMEVLRGFVKEELAKEGMK